AKAACYMKCPKCGETLKESTFQKVTVDRCPECHGVWLDAGELDQVAKREEGTWLGKLWQKNS
ncbi:MAG TPA: zf-TFIIB domain-containing protein, partial [Candidatus Binatia bacterium]